MWSRAGTVCRVGKADAREAGGPGLSGRTFPEGSVRCGVFSFPVECGRRGSGTGRGIGMGSAVAIVASRGGRQGAYCERIYGNAP
jgi:hypothetical protein